MVHRLFSGSAINQDALLSCLVDAVQSYDTHEEVIARLQLGLRPGDFVLVKGSRGMHLDEVVGAIRVADQCKVRQQLPTSRSDGVLGRSFGENRRDDVRIRGRGQFQRLIERRRDRRAQRRWRQSSSTDACRGLSKVCRRPVDEC